MKMKACVKAGLRREHEMLYLIVTTTTTTTTTTTVTVTVTLLGLIFQNSSRENVAIRSMRSMCWGFIFRKTVTAIMTVTVTVTATVNVTTTKSLEESVCQAALPTSTLRLPLRRDVMPSDSVTA
jgi:hypothetical protein